MGIAANSRSFFFLTIAIIALLDFGPQLQEAAPSGKVPASTAPRRIGRIESSTLVECSGMDVSTVSEDLLWAVNDGGNGPFIHALGNDGRDRGRLRMAGAENRDWEDLATFTWHEHPMILVADFGDNKRRRRTHWLYIIEEPRLDGERFRHPVAVNPVWRIAFAYPDGNHDAEGVAVDSTIGQILILTKRDQPPLLFSLPLKPRNTAAPLVARRVAAVDRIPSPTNDDLLYPYGRQRSQPTALDISSNGRTMVVLTYKHAYLFNREPGASWQAIAGALPTIIPLPLPQDNHDLAQREAVCFSKDGKSLWVTSEGRHPGLYRVVIDRRP